MLLADSGFEHCVLRCGGIYGPGPTRLIDTVAAGTASFDPTEPSYTNRIHADDVAGAAAFLLFHPAPGRLVLGVDEEPAELGDVLTWLANELGVAPPTAGVSDAGRARRSASNKRVNSEKLRQLGFRLRYPTYREGYAELLRARRSLGD
jgi:nucleoside-diphosphate-sugar epimerase